MQCSHAVQQMIALFLHFSISGVLIASVSYCRYLETVSMQNMFSADLAAATGAHLDNALSAILVAFEGIIQVSECMS